jgi:hypothetical protein
MLNEPGGVSCGHPRRAITGQARRGETEFEILAALSTRVRSDAGWHRRNVGGWMFTDELNQLGPWGAHLPHMAALGLIRREDALEPGRRAPRYINRITQAGEDYLAEQEGRAPFRIPARTRVLPEIDLEMVYISPQTWRCLQVVTTADHDIWLSSTNLGNAFKAPERKFLESRGLIEVRTQEGSARPNALLYRATDLARRARAIDTATDPARLQIHVPGIRAWTSPGSG